MTMASLLAGGRLLLRRQRRPLHVPTSLLWRIRWKRGRILLGVGDIISWTFAYVRVPYEELGAALHLRGAVVDELTPVPADRGEAPSRAR
jgi:hypothetical protein